MRTYRCDWCGKEFRRLECYMKGKNTLFVLVSVLQILAIRAKTQPDMRN